MDSVSKTILRSFCGNKKSNPIWTRIQINGFNKQNDDNSSIESSFTKLGLEVRLEWFVMRDVYKNRSHFHSFYSCLGLLFMF